MLAEQERRGQIELRSGESGVGGRGGDNRGHFFGNTQRGLARIRRTCDWPADDQVIGPGLDGLGRGRDAGLVVCGGACGSYARHNDQEFRPAGCADRRGLRGWRLPPRPAPHPCASRARARARAPGEPEMPTSERAAASMLVRIVTPSRAGRFLCSARASRAALIIALAAEGVQGKQPDAWQPRSRGDRPSHGVRNVVELQVEEYLEPEARERFDGSRAFCREQTGYRPSSSPRNPSACEPRHTPARRGLHPGRRLVVTIRAGRDGTSRSSIRTLARPFSSKPSLRATSYDTSSSRPST